MRLFTLPPAGLASRLLPLCLAMTLAVVPVSWAATDPVPLAEAAIPLAGTLISNVALGEFVEEGSTVVQSSRSNTVQTTILPVYALTLTATQSRYGVAGQMIRFSHELRNTGNSNDTYTLTLTDLASDAVNFTDEAVYLDRNRDGVADGAALTAAELAALPLRPGERIGLLVMATVPVGTSAATYANALTLSAQSNGDNTVPAVSNNDSLVVSSNAVIEVTKAFSATTASNGTTVTVTLSYRNLSSTASGSVTLTDTLPATLVYQSGSGQWSGGPTVTDAAGGDSAGLAYDYNGTTKVVTAVLASVPANGSGTLQFTVQVNSATAAIIPNTVPVVYDPDNNVITNNNVTTSTNTALLTVSPSYGVVMNSLASSASTAPANDTQTLSNLAQGAVASYTNYVWNTGNIADTYNITLNAASTLPAGSVVELYRADGATPLLDSNGDGIPDTGPLAAGSAFPVVVKIRLPLGFTDSTAAAYTAVLRAQSVASPATSDPTNDVFSTVTATLVDLTNQSPVTGTGNGVVDNAGAALKTLSLNAGGQVIFPLAVKNTGQPTSYVLSADADGNFAQISLPAGISVRFAQADAGNSCTTPGAPLSQTRVLASNETQYVCAIVQADSSVSSQNNVPIYFRAASAAYVTSNLTTNPGFDTIKDAINLSAINAALSFEPDLRGQIAPGGTIVYTHILRNNGTTALTATQPFAITQSQSGFVTTLYYDSNDNGVLDSTDPIVTDLDAFISNGSAGLDAGESIRLFAKVQNNGLTAQNAENTTLIRLLDNTGTELDRVTDITTLGATQIRLSKQQALDSNCDGTPEGSYTSATLPIQRNSNGSGQCVLYRLTVRNEGTTTVTQFTFHDGVPAATLLESGPTCTGCTPASLSGPAVGNTGNVSGTVPTLRPGEQYLFNFAVRYNGP